MLMLQQVSLPINNYCLKSFLVECPIAHDCKAWLEAGVNKSGIYPIKPDNKGSAFQVTLQNYGICS